MAEMGWIVLLTGPIIITYYAETAEGGLKNLPMQGLSWTDIVSGITETGPWVTVWLQDPKTSTTLYSGFSNVWKSTNSGAVGLQ